MKLLITGSKGFIGKNLAEWFQNQYVIKAPGRKELDLLDSSAVERYLEKERFDIIIHAANTNNTRNTSVTSEEVLDRNLRMYFNLERCNAYYGRMYYFGSGAEYDMQHYIPDMGEEYFGVNIPHDAYGFSKYIMSKVSERESNIYDLRLFGVYGKYEEWERRFISNAICRALKGKSITIQKNVYFDYLWIDDLCRIMEWFLKNEPAYKQYNVCRGSRIDLYYLACMIREILDLDCEIIVREQGWKPEYTGNNKRLLKEIGDFPFTGFQESICRLCEFYKAQIHMIDESKLIG